MTELTFKVNQPIPKQPKLGILFPLYLRDKEERESLKQASKALGFSSASEFLRTAAVYYVKQHQQETVAAC